MTVTWKLQDAKARFSEVVRLALTAGPQDVTVRGGGHNPCDIGLSKDRVGLIASDWL
jgi:hypothetical protein